MVRETRIRPKRPDSLFFGREGVQYAVDFMGVCTLETLRARVPSGRNSQWVQQKDGVVGHCFDEQAVTSFLQLETLNIARLGPLIL